MSTASGWYAHPIDGRTLLAPATAADASGRFDDVLFGGASTAQAVIDAQADEETFANRRRVVAIVIVSIVIVAIVVAMGALGYGFLSGLSDNLRAR